MLVIISLLMYKYLIAIELFALVEETKFQGLKGPTKSCFIWPPPTFPSHLGLNTSALLLLSLHKAVPFAWNALLVPLGQ